jgi:geranylgeranyl diphosphate synthase type II
VGGQVLDIEAEQRACTEQEVLDIQSRKTGALIRAACEMGVVCGGGSPTQREAAGRYADCIGLAFQIQDDILDVTGDEKTLGKPVHSDEKNGKTTYVVLKGLQKSHQTAEALLREASDIMTASGGSTEFLFLLAESLTGRRK